MDLVLGWLIDKVLLWQALRPVPRYAIVALTFSLGVWLAYVGWVGFFLHRELWSEVLISDAIH